MGPKNKESTRKLTLSPQRTTGQTLKSLTKSQAEDKRKKSRNTDVQHKCSFCKKSFVRKTEYNNHLKTHAAATGKVSLKCSVCDNIYSGKKTLRNHERLKHGIRISHHCSTCDKSFKFKRDLYQHMLTHTDGKPFKCPTCSAGFPSNFSLKRHQTMHSEDRPHKCSLCEKSFKTAQFRNVHINGVHNNIRPHKCSFCDKSFSMASNRKIHERIHTGERPFKCPFCEMSFGSNGNKLKHIESHKTGTPLKCSFCEKLFRYYRDQIKHENKRHPEEAKSHKQLQSKEKQIKCILCEKTFPSRNLRMEHLLTHSVDPNAKTKERKINKCSICDIVFSRSSSLQNHYRRLHLKEKTEICVMCDKAFSCYKELEVHMRSHTKEKPYKCPTCSKFFSSSSNLIKHRVTHSEKTPYRCSSCLTDFKTLGHKKYHIKTAHRKVRNYKCRFCEMTFKVDALMKNHEKLHFPNRPFKCHLGEWTFKTKEYRKKHLRTHFRESPFKRTSSSERTSMELPQTSEQTYTTATPKRRSSSEKRFQAPLHQNHPTNNKTVHPNVSTRECGYCGKKFTTASQKESHEQLHLHSLPVRPFRCVFCEKTFETKEHRQKHLRTHNSQTPFTCALCEKTFRSKELRQSHEQSHFSKQLHQERGHFEGPSQPSVNTASSKPQEIIIERSENPSTSTSTNRSFVPARNRIKRVVRFRKRFWSCTTCGKNFLAQENLISHRKTHDVLMRAIVISMSFA